MVSRWNLPSKVTIRHIRANEPRNTRERKVTGRKSNATHDRAKRIIKKYKNLSKRKKQNGGSLLGNIAKWRVQMAAKTLLKKGLNTESKALSSEIGKKLIHEGIKHAPELYKLGASKIRNKNVTAAPDCDVENYIVKETQKKAEEDLDNLSSGV